MKRRSRRGAALVIALMAAALVGALAAAGGVRAYGLRADRLRDDRQARLRAALWHAVWAQLVEAAAVPDGAPADMQREAPDGVKTLVTVQRAGEPRRHEPVRYALSARAELGPERREAWALAQRERDGSYRVPIWVER